MARPTVSAPIVSVARPRSRTSEPRVSRSATGAMSANGIPASRPSGPRRNGVNRVASSRIPYTASQRRSPALPAAAGNSSKPPSATTPNTTTSQRRRAPTMDPGMDGRSASIGEIRPARTAGSSAAARVTSVPTMKAIATAEACSGGPWIGTRPVTRMYRAIAPARPIPNSTPSPDPASPMTRAWLRMSRLTCPRLAPAARSRPTSRTRSVTVMARVLKMRKAPPNRASAATRAVVD